MMQLVKNHSLRPLKFPFPHCSGHYSSSDIFTQGLPIDYRWDNENKLSSWGDILVSLAHCVDEDSRIPKMPVINPVQALAHPRTSKNYRAWIANLQPQLLRISLFFVNRSAD
jgi:hypothetical protein